MDISPNLSLVITVIVRTSPKEVSKEKTVVSKAPSNNPSINAILWALAPKVNLENSESV